VSFKKFFSRLTASAPEDYILVVGAAHIDVLADYKSAEQAQMDKVGSVRYSIGGTSYNIAINLAQSGIPVSLLTVLKKNSFSATWIRERLEGAGVQSQFIQVSDHLPESGFVAFRSDGVLKSAVTSTAVAEYTFQARLIDEAMGRARFVVMDCNLAVDQMSLLLDCARRHNRPVAIAAVSDSKVTRILQLEDHQLIDIVVLNDLEARAVASPETGDSAQNLCGRLGAKYVVVTHGAGGYQVISESGQSAKQYAAPQIERIVSQSGAGDALFAGILAYWYRHQTLDFDGAKSTIANSVRRVLQQPGATLGSLATDVDFARLARIAVRDEPFWKRIFSPEIGVATSIIVAILTVVILVLTYQLLPTSATKPPSTVSGAASKKGVPNAARP
jgi:sugar/nucleoside kinase (ribokinase family)